jgi:hypothetical protein
MTSSVVADEYSIPLSRQIKRVGTDFVHNDFVEFAINI